MAEIKMDVSEYEEMKKVQALLEDSLKRERSLQEENKRLVDEKIKALEDAKMNVTKVEKKIIEEHFYRPYSGYEWHYREPVRFMGCEITEYEARNLVRLFFKREKKEKVEKSISVHGLDEIKAELRKELKIEIDNDFEAKMQKANQFQQKEIQYLDQIDNLKLHLEKVTDIKDCLIKDKENLEKEVERLLDNNIDSGERFDRIRDLVNNTPYLQSKQTLCLLIKNIL